MTAGFFWPDHTALCADCPAAVSLADARAGSWTLIDPEPPPDAQRPHTLKALCLKCARERVARNMNGPAMSPPPVVGT